MKILNTISLFLFFIVLNPIYSQNKLENGKKIGYWEHKDAKGLVYAEGKYTNDSRDGIWKFYISEYSRTNRQPDVHGVYNNAGSKQGEWVYTNFQTKTSVQVEFTNNLMQGECLYYDENNSISYDYFLDVNTHVKGNLSFANGTNTGRLDFYKIEQHPTFGLSETLVGSGAYANGKKIGRWIEFNHGTKGDFIETGNYDENGKRNGLWKIRIAHQTYLAGSYNDGIPHGKFNHSLKLAYEQHFLLVEEDFSEMHYEYITWLQEPGYSIAPDELNRRFDLYRTYGFETHPRIENITVKNRKTVREGDYLAFYKDGGLKLKGSHSPHTASLFNPNERTVTQSYARTGEWKEYGEDELLKSTYIYENGKLKKMLDPNGYIVHTFKYEANSINITDNQGNTINICL